MDDEPKRSVEKNTCLIQPNHQCLAGLNMKLHRMLPGTAPRQLAHVIRTKFAMQFLCYSSSEINYSFSPDDRAKRNNPRNSKDSRAIRQQRQKADH